jgi:hypothetical protein
VAPALAFLGLHLTPPVRELTRDATAVEARTLARAQRLVLRALPRSAAAGPIGRAALVFAVSVEAGSAGEALPRLKRLAVGLTRLRVVESVSLLVRPANAGDAGLEAAWVAGLPSVAVEAAAFEAGGAALLPDRVYVVDAGEDEAPLASPIGRRAPPALSSGDE